MKGHLRGLLVWASLAVLSFAIGDFVDPYRHRLWAILPTTIFHLDRGSWTALGMTALASSVAWVVACVVGYHVGVVAATLHASPGSGNLIRRLLGRSLDRIYQYVYIIPFVLVVSISFGVFYPLCVETVASKPVLPKWCLWVWMVVASGTTLGGYRVFRSVFSAVERARHESEQLVHGLYTVPRRPAWLGDVRARRSRVLRLKDCEIESVAEGLEQAFLLAVVAIMIVEAVIPGFHEYLVEQRGVLSDWARGAGGLVVRKQDNMQVTQVSGIMWAVLIFDTIALHMIGLATFGLWMRHYQRPSEEAST